MAYDIRFVKLINGDTVIGKYDATANCLNEVVLLQTVPTQQGVQLAMLPFGYPFEQEICAIIKYEHVLYQFKSFPEDLETKYLEATSNLTLASAGFTGGQGSGLITDLSGIK